MSVPYATATRRDAIIMDCNTGHAQYFIGFTNETTGVIRKILISSDLTSTVTSGSDAVITSGGIYTTFQGRDATINTSFPNYRSGFCKYVSIGAFNTSFRRYNEQCRNSFGSTQ